MHIYFAVIFKSSGLKKEEELIKATSKEKIMSKNNNNDINKLFIGFTL